MSDDRPAEDVEPVERVRLNLRVDPDVKAAFEDAIFDKYRGKRPYCGIVLERECRFRLDDSKLNELWGNVDALADEFGQRDRKEKISQPDRGETTVVHYRIAENVRNDIKQFAEATHYDSAGEFIEAVMWRFANGRGREEHLVDRTDRILQSVEGDNELSAVQRRTKRVAETVGADGAEFDMDAFDAALDDARGINATAYTRKKYLPRVLDELGYTWTKGDVFVDAEAIDTDARDPREKPYILMDTDDRRLALKYELWAISTTTAGDSGLIEVDDAADVLDGRPKKTTVRTDLRQIGESPGFEYVKASARTSPDADDGLRINHRHVARSNAHDDLRECVDMSAYTDGEGSPDLENPSDGTDDAPTQARRPTADGGEPDDDPADATSWTDAVVSKVVDVPFDSMPDEQVDTILRGKIAKERYAEPGEIDEDGATLSEARLDELEAQVTDDDLDAVRRELGLPEIGEKDADEIAEEADAVFDALEGADRARADGGRPVK